MSRPKSNRTLPTPTERVKKSIDALVARGGKRLMLRLSPDGYDALKKIMALEKFGTETQAINVTLVERSKRSLNRDCE